ncbi:MAG: hypothetical protein GYA24_15480 [Candidatus Lokiarchaeota archaeon]|nr:hypothetical protein [Candidatus Lokiarchaeota archaeon]
MLNQSNDIKDFLTGLVVAFIISGLFIYVMKSAKRVTRSTGGIGVAEAIMDSSCGIVNLIAGIILAATISGVASIMCFIMAGIGMIVMGLLLKDSTGTTTRNFDFHVAIVYRDGTRYNGIWLICKICKYKNAIYGDDNRTTASYQSIQRRIDRILEEKLPDSLGWFNEKRSCPYCATPYLTARLKPTVQTARTCPDCGTLCTTNWCKKCGTIFP